MDEFTGALLRQLDEAEALGCQGTRMRQAIRQYGGVKMVKETLRRNRDFDTFRPLAEQGRLDLSPEALAVTARFGALFTDEEVNLCLERLCAGGYSFRKK